MRVTALAKAKPSSTEVNRGNGSFIYLKLPVMALLFDLHVYPVKTKYAVTITTNVVDLSYTINDQYGNTIKSGHISGKYIQVDVSSLSRGSYFLTVMDGKASAIAEFFKL